MFLLDTNVISALAPSKRAEAGELAVWLDRASPNLFLSVITAAEVAAGIAKAEREGAGTKARVLAEWWQAVEHFYGTKVLPFDLRCAHLAGGMLDRARAHRPGFEDIAIAATAEAHGLIVLTRNLRHFAPLGVSARDPFQGLPPLPETG
ncbi:Ribonuclease VapC [Bosea sp. 62]|uniref:type II toxin-antitoxin system VapC family toxin n=1 Tax=unclassified Bosea (in: a-proteobacteria) TaxID=2653178 RepID=UPI0012553FD5|nr:MULTISPECIES: type II toxin-antitoxin system VapC family toxin [unclassified Bosea (in: a-proteobacteria)]CAD5253821.1 Ribonuclease VapC [Bosea sp. 7B]CAD5277419.1 Ribonuclease VapC [Bosea sp. 21B]CAD5278461.1 Ribonuclease VapC [Bosea sp. 46]VVT59772.1 Ribonuclease VapC [Bosea sp. EC-HK365B]VXB42718.1 Ribonuclease VapC [Bosea sp. 62]